MKDTIKRLSEGKRLKTSISITIDEVRLKRAKKILKEWGQSVSAMFDMFLADFLDSVEQTDWEEEEETEEKKEWTKDRIEKYKKKENNNK